MTTRRSFLRHVAAATGASALAAFEPARSALAAELEGVRSRAAGQPDLAWLRTEYMLAPDVLYFNHASIGTVPRAVHEALVRYLEVCEANPHLHIWGDVWDAPRESVRAAAGALLRCAPADVAITHNTTEGFNTLAQGLPLGPGDEVLFSTLNHGGASAPWQHHGAARGYATRRFEFPLLDTPSLSAADVVEIHMREITDRTRMLVFPHIDNIVGLRHPVAALVRAARARGVEYVAVDGAQAAGHIPVDVVADDVDFYAASPHKWIQSPKGLGLFYVRAAHRERLRPMWVTSGQVPRGTVRIYEDYGTRNSPGVLALGDALAFQASLGEPAKTARYRAMWTGFRDAVEAAPHLSWRSPVDWDLSCSIYAVEVKGQQSAALAERMYARHGAVFRPFARQGVETIRISPNTMTTDAEIARLLELLAAEARG